MFKTLTRKRTKLFTLILQIAVGVPMLAQAQTQEKVFTIFQTSDIHSHFDNRASEKHLGGVARLKTLIDSLRARTPNSVLLDAGDWSEGTLFFALGNGYSSQSVMEVMHYDAMALGNHDWLIGPQALTQAFASSHLSAPVVSANLNFDSLPNTIPLRNYIKPYTIKVVNGVKIGIFGLSTFQLIYDSYFQPVTLQQPFTVAAMNANYLRDVEKCDVVIALSHMGVEFDRILAKTVSGIDVIAGGHSHKLFLNPEIIGGVAINHVGKWGEYVGEMEIGVPHNGRPYLKSSRLNAVNETIPENPQVAKMVEGYKGEIEREFGERMFEDQIFSSLVHDHLTDLIQDEPVGNWAVDAVREAVGAEVGFDHSKYVQQNVLPGIVTSADIFNMWPHLYNSSTHKAWTIHTFQISGAALELMVQAFFRVGGGLKMSNTRVVMDYSATIQRLSSITIGNEPLQSLRKYKVAATEGIIEAFDFLDSHFGTKLGATQMQDTGIEAWRVIREKLKRIGTLGPGNASWQGRVRSLQPDLYLPYEELVSWPGFGTVGGRFEIVNIGMQAATVEGVRIKLYISADGGVTKPWVQLTQPQYNFTSLAAGKNAEVRFQQNLPDLRPGQHLYIAISVRKANGELHLENNRLETMLY